MTGAAAVRVRDLCFSYPDGRQVLFGVDLDLAAGERVALLGPNGAGKTTLLLHLNGIHRSTSGGVEIDGEAVTADTARAIRRRVGMVFQDPDDQLFMPSVGEDVAFGPRNYGISGEVLDATVEKALAAVGLSGMAPSAPQRLSLGQRRRAAIATILAMDIDVMVLDEPTSNLDPSSRRELTATLAGVPSTILVATHDLPYALELCPRSVVLNEGRIVADGPTLDILSDQALMRANGLELPRGFTPEAS